MLDAAIVQTNLQREQQCKQELVIFIESSTRITKNFKSEIINDVLDAFGGDGRALRPDVKIESIRTNAQNWRGTHLFMEISKSPRNWRNEVWYMTFTMDIWTMRK